MRLETTETLIRVRLTRQEAVAVQRALQLEAAEGTLRTARCVDVYLDTRDARLARSAQGAVGMFRAVLRERPGEEMRWLAAEHETDDQLTVRADPIAPHGIPHALVPPVVAARFPFLPQGLAPVLAVRSQRHEWQAAGATVRLDANTSACPTRLEQLREGPPPTGPEALELSGGMLSITGPRQGLPSWLVHLVNHAPVSPDAFHLVWLRTRPRTQAALGTA
ncbi:MAG TPA: hypothetical protein VK013_05615 [Myxococcaceae bacterium]|nr:hypothetical protein [Myxococcaceae bacterium]